MNQATFIIIVNDEISKNIKQTLVSQLFINEVIDFNEYISRVLADSNYNSIIHNTFRRVMVLCNFGDERFNTYKDTVDACLYCKNGLVSITKGDNKYTQQIKSIQGFDIVSM